MKSAAGKMAGPNGLTAGSRAALSGKLTATGHRLEMRVYYADTDFSGTVYHARYLEFLERGRIEYLRRVGVYHSELSGEKPSDGIVWVIRRLEIEYRQPARVDDLLIIETTTADISAARVRIAQTIRCCSDILISARVECALVDLRGRPRRFPKEWRRLFRPQNAQD